MPGRAPATAPAPSLRLDPAQREQTVKSLICSACRRRSARRIIVVTMKTACSVRVHWPHGWRVKMSEKIYDVPAEWTKRAWVDQAKYREMYARSVSDPSGFWAEQARRIDWMKPFTKGENASFAPGNISIKW